MNKKILDSVFRAYDIRGKYPSELTEDFFENLGKAYATHFKPEKVVVGYDIRAESPVLMKALAKGLMDSGVDVTMLGEIATEMLYFATGEYSEIYDGGMVVTASHNPSGWNGCKMVNRNAKPISADTGLGDLKKIMLEGSFKKVKDTPGVRSELDIYPQFKHKILSFIKTAERRDVDIVVDAGNGIGGKVFDYIFGDLGIDVKRLFFIPDGTYPNHVPDPMKEENDVPIKNEVLNGPYDFGIAIDGDADRVFFIDKRGRKLDGAYTGVLIANHLLKDAPLKKVVHDPRSSIAMREETKKIGAETIECRVGHSFIKKVMADEKAVFGAEASSHFYYKDFYNADSGMVTIAVILDLVFSGFDLTEQWDRVIEAYPKSGEVNYKVENQQEVIDSIEQHYRDQGAQISYVDGISVEFDDWRFNMRLSNTESLLRLNLEALDKKIVIEKFKEVESLIGVKRDNMPFMIDLRD